MTRERLPPPDRDRALLLSRNRRDCRRVIPPAVSPVPMGTLRGVVCTPGRGQFEVMPPDFVGPPKPFPWPPLELPDPPFAPTEGEKCPAIPEPPPIGWGPPWWRNRNRNALPKSEPPPIRWHIRREISPEAILIPPRGHEK